MRLQRIGPQHIRPAVAELEVGNGELLSFATNDRPVFAPIELKRFPGCKAQGHERAATCTHGFVLVLPPRTRKGTDSVIGARITQSG